MSIDNRHEIEGLLKDLATSAPNTSKPPSSTTATGTTTKANHDATQPSSPYSTTERNHDETLPHEPTARHR